MGGKAESGAGHTVTGNVHGRNHRASAETAERSIEHLKSTPGADKDVGTGDQTYELHSNQADRHPYVRRFFMSKN